MANRFASQYRQSSASSAILGRPPAAARRAWGGAPADSLRRGGEARASRQGTRPEHRPEHTSRCSRWTYYGAKPFSALLASALLVICLVVCLVVSLLVSPARADPSAPPVLDQVDVVEALGKKVPLDLSFLSSAGMRVRLSDVVSGQRPILLTLVYFRCPMLCGLVLRGMVRSLKTLNIQPGTDVDLLTVSFDPDDRPTDAAQQRQLYLQSLGVSEAEPVWPFLTGDEREVHALADSVGFHYTRVPHTSDFAHPAVSFVLTPDGTISRYLYGMDFPERDLRLSLAEATGGGWGNSFDRFLLHCFQYDPATRRYGFYVSTYFKACGVLVLLGTAMLIVRPFRFVRRKPTSHSH